MKSHIVVRTNLFLTQSGPKYLTAALNAALAELPFCSRTKEESAGFLEEEYGIVDLKKSRADFFLRDHYRRDQFITRGGTKITGTPPTGHTNDPIFSYKVFLESPCKYKWGHRSDFSISIYELRNLPLKLRGPDPLDMKKMKTIFF